MYYIFMKIRIIWDISEWDVISINEWLNETYINKSKVWDIVSGVSEKNYQDWFIITI